MHPNKFEIMINSQFRSISLSHRNAPLHIREQVALNEQEAKDLMLHLKEFFEVSDLLVVSTCNRTEIYYHSEKDLSEDLIKILLIRKGITDTQAYIAFFEILASGNQAARHLFEVATGLHSQVIGDMQIPNQIKFAYQWSADLNMAGPYLHRLMHTIFFANKRVAQETSFRDGAASVSYATVELAESLANNPKILVVGLGEIGTDVCKNLAALKNADVTLMNRTFAKAERIASNLGFQVAAIEDLENQIARADVIISSVTRDTPLFTKEMMWGIGALTFKYFIDLSVPRSVDASIEDVPGVVLYNVDAIRSRTDRALQARIEAIPQVNTIIDTAMEDFNDWSKEMAVSPTIQRPKNALENIRKEEMSRFVKGMKEDEIAVVDKITSSMMQKIIKLPVLQLKAACKRGEAETLIDVLNDLFNLEEQKDPMTH